MRVLTAWVGNADLRGAEGNNDRALGPIAGALAAREFDRVWLLANMDPAQTRQYIKWLKKRTSARIDLEQVSLSSPTNMEEIHSAVVGSLERLLQETGPGTQLTFHLSPGTPAMATVWVLLGKTRFPANFLKSSPERGVEDENIPFDIAADFLPVLFEGPDRRLIDRAREVADTGARFGDIYYRSTEMERVVQRARRAAIRSVPVLIQGESGTGKELLAKAIVNEGPRKDKPLRVVNCGAIPSELIESELFGHAKGAFTGATKDRPGYFEDADGGTLFLDEIGELPLAAQVKLLRILQEKEVTRVGTVESRKVDVRVIAATNKDLATEVANGRFRADLFYRMAVLILQVPPLREREGDVSLLIEKLLQRVNEESQEDPGYSAKKLSAGAKRLLQEMRWPGNVRQLQNTLRRAAVWSDDSVISERDIREATQPEIGEGTGDADILGPVGEGVDLQRILSRVKRHYLDAALEATGGNRSKAAKLLGLRSHQVFSDWDRKTSADLAN